MHIFLFYISFLVLRGINMATRPKKVKLSTAVDKTGLSKEELKKIMIEKDEE